MTNELLSKQNITTIATWIAIGITMIVSYFGFELDLTPAIPVIAGIITLIIAIYSSKHPNTLDFLGNSDSSVNVTVDQEMLEQTIQDLMEKYNTDSTIDVESDDVVGIDDS